MLKVYELTDGVGFDLTLDSLTAAKAAAERHHGGPMYWGKAEPPSRWSPVTWYAYVRPYRDGYEDDEVVSAYRVQMMYVKPDGTLTYLPHEGPSAT